MNRTALLPVGLLALCVVPLAFAAPWTPVLLLIPLAVALWVLRAGVDVADDGLTLRSLVGQRRVPWTELVGIRVAPRGDLWLVTTGGTQVKVPVMRARDLPRLAAVSGGRIDVPEPPAQ
jgi:predicted membrane-bound mannosyltransferase